MSKFDDDFPLPRARRAILQALEEACDEQSPTLEHLEACLACQARHPHAYACLRRAKKAAQGDLLGAVFDVDEGGPS